MSEPTIDVTERCVVCGSLIWSFASIQRGYGSECAAAIQEAKAKRVFTDPELKSAYYRIEAEMLINYISHRNFRSDFRKSFQASVVKQATWLSKKQAEICRSILFDYDNKLAEGFDAELKQRREQFWETIEITRDDIEIARQIIRKKRNKSEE
jgi:hypothetical protein